MGRRRTLAVAALAALLAACFGCGGRVAQVVVADSGGVRVQLRGPADPGPESAAYEHPMVISPARLAHILSRIDVYQKESDAREPAIPTELLYAVADGTALALEAAQPHQQVIVTATRTDRRFGIFTHEYVSGFVTYRADDQLHIHFSHVEWEVPRGPDKEIPEPRIDRHPMKFRVVPGTAMALTGAQSLAVTWRDPIFDAPTAVQVSPFGRTRRRTILMESAEDVAGEEAAPALPALSPEALRQLADLEEARLGGGLTEAEYQAERERILRGDAGDP